jgi:hypothetical protein
MKYADDQDVERTLRRYRPADPRPALRQAVIESRPSAAPWAAVAAALLAAVVLLKVGMAHEINRLPGEAVDLERESVEQLAEALGGDGEARRAAWILVQQEVVRHANAARPEGGNAQ